MSCLYPEWDDEFFGHCEDHGDYPIEQGECPVCRCINDEEEIEGEI